MTDRFNRYIVECKFYKWDDISSVKIDLIDT